MNKKRILLSGVTIAVLSILLSGCNDGTDTTIDGASSEELVSSQIISSGYISNLNYTCDISKINNLTTEEGVLKCKSIDTVTFNLGAFKLPSVSQSPLIHISNIYDESDIQNKIQLVLETLDTDKDYTNGIQIDTSLSNKISQNYDINSLDFLQNIGNDIGIYIENKDVLSHSTDYLNSLTYTPEGNFVSAQTNEDTVLTGILTVLQNEDNIDLKYYIQTDVTNGTLEVDTSGVFTYTPNLNFNGTDSFTYIVESPTEISTPVTVSLTVTPVIDQLIPSYTVASVVEDEEFEGQLTTINVDDVDVTYKLVTNSINGTTTINTDGSFTYLSNPNFNGTDSFEYSVSSIEGYDIVNQTVNLTISNSEDTISSENTSFSFNEDTELNENIKLKNDSNLTIDNIEILTDFTNGNLEITKVDNENLNISINGITPNYHGTSNITYKIITEEGGDEIIHNIAINVIPVVDYITFNGTNIVFTEDTNVTQQLSFNNPDNYDIKLSISSDMSKGIVTIPDSNLTNYDFTSLSNINTTNDLIEFQIEYTTFENENITLTQEYPVTITAVNDVPTIPDLTDNDGDSVTSSDVTSSYRLPSGFDPDTNDEENPDSLIYEFKLSDIEYLNDNTNIEIEMTDESTGDYDVTGTTDEEVTVQFRIIDNSNIPSEWKILHISSNP